MKTRNFKTYVQRGFTLLELVVVVAVVGVLISIFAPNLVSSKEGANAQLLLRVPSQMAQNWMLINQACGTSSAVSGSPLTNTGKTVSDILFGGSANVAAAYTNCYAQSKVLPLTEVAQPSGSSGIYNVGGYTVTLTGGGTSPLSIAYATVPDSLALLMAQKYNPTLATLAASDNTSAVLQYSTATAGTRTVSVLKAIN